MFGQLGQEGLRYETLTRCSACEQRIDKWIPVQCSWTEISGVQLVPLKLLYQTNRLIFSSMESLPEPVI